MEFLNGFVKTNIGAHWRPFAPWLGTVALYIGLSNLIGIFGLVPPTKDISVTAALALMSMFLIYGAQFRYNGLAGGLKKFAEPMPLLIPINLMEVAIRPLALCMRLFGNILGAFIIMEMLKLLVPVVLPAVFSLYFDLFDGLIQTVVFVFLTTLFTGEGIEERLNQSLLGGNHYDTGNYCCGDRGAHRHRRVGIGFAAGKATGKASEAIARQPEAAGRINSALLLGCALAEGTAIFGFIAALLVDPHGLRGRPQCWTSKFPPSSLPSSICWCSILSCASSCSAGSTPCWSSGRPG